MEGERQEADAAERRREVIEQIRMKLKELGFSVHSITQDGEWVDVTFTSKDQVYRALDTIGAIYDVLDYDFETEMITISLKSPND